MNISVKKANTAFLLLLFLCSNCTQERQRIIEQKEEAFTPYTLELATILIPSSWEKKDYEPNSENVEEPYVFMAPENRQDRLLGDAIMVVVKKNRMKPNLKLLQNDFVKSMEVDGQNKVKMLSFQDSVFADSELILVDYDNRFPSQNLYQICTYGSYYRKGAVISIIGVALRRSAHENLKKRILFRKVIYSVKWIKE